MLPLGKVQFSVYSEVVKMENDRIAFFGWYIHLFLSYMDTNCIFPCVWGLLYEQKKKL